MKTQLTQLKEFHTVVNSQWQDTPALTDDTNRDFRIKLMREEFNEVAEAMKEGDLAHIAKELADLLYTVFGTVGTYGLAEKMPQVFDAVHESNMSKNVKDDMDVKAVKGDGFKEADISSILNS